MNSAYNLLYKKKLFHAFSKKAKYFDDATFVSQEIGNRLLERLSYTKISPKNILCVGSGTGFCLEQTKQLYPQANLYAIDISLDLLKFSKEKKRDSIFYICADAENLPFPSHTFDLIISNCTLPWISDKNLFFKDIHRLLSATGLLLFSTLGPNTLQELKNCYMCVDSYEHINNFVDMHLIGDTLLKHQFNDPVVDTESITIQYNDMFDLLKDLKHSGSVNLSTENINPYLQTKNLFKHLNNAYKKIYPHAETFNITYEIIYGSAWAAQITNRQYSPIDSIKISS